MTAPLNASAPAFAPLPSQTQAIKVLLASGPQRISITAEREKINATPDRPSFLQGVRFNPAESRKWYEEVLPYLSKCIFIVSSTADVTYGGKIFGSAALPHLYNAITKVELPKFYWFSGTGSNRHHNPYLQMCRNLPNLRELTFTMHAAGLTSQRWAERQVVALEHTNPEAAKERIKLSVREVVHSYELDALFTCGGLRRLRIEYVESEMVTYFCKVGDPADVVRDVKRYLEQGFLKKAMQVVVELMQIDEEAD